MTPDCVIGDTWVTPAMTPEWRSMAYDGGHEFSRQTTLPWVNARTFSKRAVYKRFTMRYAFFKVFKRLGFLHENERWPISWFARNANAYNGPTAGTKQLTIARPLTDTSVTAILLCCRFAQVPTRVNCTTQWVRRCACWQTNSENATYSFSWLCNVASEN